MLLHEVLRNSGIAELQGESLSITGVTDDSRSVRPGSLFVAVRGGKQDGRGFLAQAVAAGAVALAGAGADPRLGVPWIVLDDDRRDLARLAAAYHGHPARDLRIVGVTGTNGKTTTTFLLQAILGAAGLPCGLIGTIRYVTGMRRLEAPLTTPGPVLLQGLLSEMRSAGLRAVATEVSSHALVQQRVCELPFEVAVFTNVTPEHLDFHGDFESYRAAKARLLELLSPGGVAVVNVEDPGAAWLLERIPAGVRVMTFSTAAEARADVRASVRTMDAGGTSLRLETPDGGFDVRTRLFGMHNVSNILAAAAAASAMGVRFETLAAGIGGLERVPGRLERVQLPVDFDVVIDYAHTPDAFEKILTTLRPMVRGRLQILFGCGGDRDRAKRPLMGRAAERLADRVILTADNPRGEDPRVIIDEILAGCERPDRVLVAIDRATALMRALDESQPGDLLLIAGKGHENYQILASGKTPFDDRAVARAWYERRHAQGATA